MLHFWRENIFQDKQFGFNNALLNFIMVLSLLIILFSCQKCTMQLYRCCPWLDSLISQHIIQQNRVNVKISDQSKVKYFPGISAFWIPFFIYINYLCEGSFKGNLALFPDDTTLFCKANMLEELKLEMQNHLNPLNWWFTKTTWWCGPKTKYIIFNTSRKPFFSNQLKYHAKR